MVPFRGRGKGHFLWLVVLFIQGHSNGQLKVILLLYMLLGVGPAPCAAGGGGGWDLRLLGQGAAQILHRKVTVHLTASGCSTGTLPTQHKHRIAS